MKRTLSLQRETLADLTAEDLGTVVGAVSGLVCLPPRTGYSLLECIRVTRDNCQTDLC
jgi:hypothetical protein